MTVVSLVGLNWERDGARRIIQSIDRAAISGANRLAVAAKQAAPKAFSTLTQSINSQRRALMTFAVAPSVNYAIYVHEGTDPGTQPPIQPIHDWVRVKGITPDNPKQDQVDVAFAIAHRIKKAGVQANPFMVKARESVETQIQARFMRAVEEAL